MKKKICKTTKQMWMPEDDDCSGMKLAHAYVLWQYYDKAFCPHEALMKGTLFPELYGVYAIPQ